MPTHLRGALIAAAAGAMFSCATAGRPAPPPSDGDQVKCAGINSCRGRSECAGADHSCKGHNGCRGQGWVEVTRRECLAQRGQVLD